MWGSVWIYVQWCGLAFLWNLNPQLSTQLESVIKGSLTAGSLIRLKPSCPDTLAFIQSYQSTGQKKTHWIVSPQPRWRAHDIVQWPCSVSRDVMLCFWIQSRFLGGKHRSIMLALDRSQSTYDITNSSFPAGLYLEGVHGGELCNIEINRIETRLLMLLFLVELQLNSWYFFTIHTNAKQGIWEPEPFFVPGWESCSFAS